MKVRFILLFFLPILFFATSLQSQGDEEVSKEVYKKWKQIARDYKRNPLELRDKLQGYERELAELKHEVEKLRNENRELQEEQIELEKDQTAKSREIENLEKQVTDMQNAMDTLTVNTANSGLNFFVQIGAYEKFDINHYFESVHCMNVQLDEGLNKYVIGSFGQVEKATQFRNDIRKMGIEDAWVVSKMNGERIPMTEALDIMESTSALPQHQIDELRKIYGLTTE